LVFLWGVPYNSGVMGVTPTVLCSDNKGGLRFRDLQSGFDPWGRATLRPRSSSLGFVWPLASEGRCLHMRGGEFHLVPGKIVNGLSFNALVGCSGGPSPLPHRRNYYITNPRFAGLGGAGRRGAKIRTKEVLARLSRNKPRFCCLIVYPKRMRLEPALPRDGGCLGWWP